MEMLRKKKIEMHFMFLTFICLVNLRCTLQDVTSSASVVDTTPMSSRPTMNTTTPLDNSTLQNSNTTTATSTNTNAAPLTCQKNANVNCKDVNVDCVQCKLNRSCVYGRTYNVNCSVLDGVICEGSRDFTKETVCRYCYQTPNWLHECTPAKNDIEPCRVASSPLEYVIVNCTVNDDVICLGHRQFHKRVPCNWTRGKKWSLALILSITVGGFGADRFYLGHWQQGLGKLFTFGGIGVWTLVDVILIAVGYTGPADGSHYI
ncbi:TM2 domain-containing protein C41D11.9-like [Antedon mediterranea]|uniref:TM2 domain-containing protein C41D11.9-like n=1 Tax=Antedon mediterranea TaxID=105859 RepID=UPI003AF9EF7A